MSSADTAAEQQVTLMTLHAAKGPEFPVVFLAGSKSGIYRTRECLTAVRLTTLRKNAGCVMWG